MRTQHQRGFTLIEMIGVLAVISILAALVAPKIFQVIGDSRTTRAASEVRIYQTAVAGWFKDIGTLSHLNAAGAVLTTTVTTFGNQLMTNGGTTATSGRWDRWKGPYLDVLSSPIGTSAVIHNSIGAAGAAPVATTATDFAITGAGNSVTSGRVVALVIAGAEDSEQKDVDRIIDGTLSATLGKVKYTSGGNLIIYLAHF